MSSDNTELVATHSFTPTTDVRSEDSIVVRQCAFMHVTITNNPFKNNLCVHYK